MSSTPGSGVDGIAACGVDAETRCIGRIRDSAVEAEVLDEPASTLRTTFPLIELASHASTKESSELEVCSRVGISEEEYSDIQVSSLPFLCHSFIDSKFPNRISCTISLLSTSSRK